MVKPFLMCGFVLVMTTVVSCKALHIHLLGRYGDDSANAEQQDVLGGRSGNAGIDWSVSGPADESERAASDNHGGNTSSDDSGHPETNWTEVLIGSGLLLAGARAVTMYLRSRKEKLA